MNETICAAITSRTLLRFDYEDGERVVAPYCYGLSSVGNEILRAFLVEGVTSSPASNRWRLYSVEKMSDVRRLDDEFAKNHEGYNPDDPLMDTVYCRIERD